MVLRGSKLDFSALGLGHLAVRRRSILHEDVFLCPKAIVWLSYVCMAASCVATTPNYAMSAEVSPSAIVDMFFKALEQQGRNPRVIQSGDISYEEYSVRVQATQESDHETKKRMITGLETLAKNAVNDIERERWKSEIQAIRNEEAATENRPRSAKEWISRDVFVGNNPRKRSRQESSHKESSNGSKSEQIQLCEYNGSERAFLSRFPEARNTSLSTNTFGVSSIEYCGRARSPMALAITTLLMADGGNHESFTFSPSTVAALKQVFETTAATEGLGVERIPHLVASRTFEGSEVFEIEYGMQEPPSAVKMQTRLLKMTVDPSRGFIVPVEEEYHDGKRVIRLESSDYRLASKDGVWFPWSSKETHYDPATGEVVSEREWRITAAVLNDPIDPKEFEVVVPAGEAINDSRTSTTATTYRTTAPVTIGAIAPRGDLTSIPGVTKADVLTGRQLPAASAWSWGRRLVLALTGALLAILISIAVRRRHMS